MHRRRTRRIFALAGLTLVLGLSGRLKRPIEERWQVAMAERALAAGRLDEAEDRLDVILERHPTRAWPRFLRAQVARRRGRITEAEEILQRAVDLGLSVEVARPEHRRLRDAAGRDPVSGGQAMVAGGPVPRK